MSKPRGKPFKQGNPGGPGRPALPDDVKKLRALTKATFTQLLNEFVNKSEGELVQVVESQDAPTLQKIAAAIMLKTVETADPVRFEVLMNRMIGKVRDEAELTVKPGLKEIDLSIIGKKIILGKEEG